MKYLRIILLLALLALLGCSNDKTAGGNSTETENAIALQVVDAQGRQIAHAAYRILPLSYVGDTIQSFDGVTVGRSLRETRSQAELTAEAVEKACQADVVIFFGGLNKSNYQDSEGHDRKQYELPYGQNELIEALVAVNPRLVYVNVSGNAVAMPWINKVPAIVQAWFLGSEAGTAIASVLFGDVNPSGKLPFTWYANLDQCGAHALNTYPGTWRDDHKIIVEEYKEDIFVGYRWADLSAKVRRSMFGSYKGSSQGKDSRPLFPFGYGLSYTTFQLSNLRIDKQEMAIDDELSLTIDVTNTGVRAGAETIQLYISDLKSSLPRPVKELKGFQKVFLKPGETQTVSFNIERSALSFYNDHTDSWTVEPGEFVAMLNNSSSPSNQKVRFSVK